MITCQSSEVKNCQYRNEVFDISIQNIKAFITDIILNLILKANCSIFMSTLCPSLSIIYYYEPNLFARRNSNTYIVTLSFDDKKYKHIKIQAQKVICTLYKLINGQQLRNCITKFFYMHDSLFYKAQYPSLCILFILFSLFTHQLGRKGIFDCKFTFKDLLQFTFKSLFVDLN